MSTINPRAAGAWLPYAGFIIAVAGIVYQTGQVTSEVARTKERVVKLEATDSARSDAIQTISVRTARIEAKLDYLGPPAPAPRER